MCSYYQSEGGTQLGQPWRGGHITCDFCKEDSPTCFIDGQVKGGTRWGIMCGECFKEHGAGIGQGVGQKYCRKQ